VNNKLINKLINKKPLIYTYLPEKIKYKYSGIYIESLIKKKENIYILEKEISKVRIKDINQAEKLFNIINKNSIKFVEILKYPEIRSILSKVISENK